MDWRVTNQKNYMYGINLSKKVYHLSEHNHCEFCWKTMMQSDQGYTTKDEYHWVCTQCFEDFKGEFNWRVTV